MKFFKLWAEGEAGTRYNETTALLPFESEIDIEIYDPSIVQREIGPLPEDTKSTSWELIKEPTDEMIESEMGKIEQQIKILMSIKAQLEAMKL